MDKLVYISAGCDEEGDVDFEPLLAKGTTITCQELMSVKGLLDREVRVKGEIVGFGMKPVYNVIRADDPTLAGTNAVFRCGSPDCPILIFDEDFNEPRDICDPI